MGIIARKGKPKSDRHAWFHFIDGADFELRYVNPDEREKLLDAANEKVFDVKQGKQIERINAAKLAAEIRRIGAIKSWKIDAAVLPQIIDLSEYPEPGAAVPFDEEDCEHLVRFGEGVGGFLLESFRTIAAFTAAEAAARKNALSPTPGRSSSLPPGVAQSTIAPAAGGSASSFPSTTTTPVPNVPAED